MMFEDLDEVQEKKRSEVPLGFGVQVEKKKKKGKKEVEVVTSEFNSDDIIKQMFESEK